MTEELFPWWSFLYLFMTVGQIKNTLQEAGISESNSTSRGAFTRVNTKDLTQVMNIFKPQKQAGLDIVWNSQTHKKSLYNSGRTSFGQMRQRSTCTRMMRREQLMICNHLILPWNRFPCIYWCDSSQKQQGDFWSVYGYIMCSDSAKFFRTDWTVLQSTVKQWAEAYFENDIRLKAKKWNEMAEWPEMAKSVTRHESNWACISLGEAKTKGKIPQEQAGSEESCSKGLAEHLQGRNPVPAFKLSLYN